MSGTIILLRVVHVVGGIFWVGTALFTAFFLFPALASAGPAAGAVIGGLQRRRMMTVLPIVAILTLLSGFALFYLVSGGSVGEYARSGPGRTFSMAGGLAVVAFLIGMLVGRPAGMNAARLSQQLSVVADGPAREDLQRQIAVLQKRGAVAGAIVAILLLLAATGMAVARYL